MRFKIIEISDDLKSKSKSINIRWFKIKIKSCFDFKNHDFDFKNHDFDFKNHDFDFKNHDFDFKIKIVPISGRIQIFDCIFQILSILKFI